MSNKVLYGLKDVYFAKLTETNGQISYATPVPIKGAVTLSMDAVGDRSTFWADDIPFHTTVVNAGYEGTLTVAKLPDEFYTAILGATVDSKGAITETADDVNSRFALGFAVDGDKKGRRTWFYDCTATRPGAENGTKENSVNVATQSLSIAMAPRSTDRKTKTTIEPNASNETEFNGWFTAVYQG